MEFYKIIRSYRQLQRLDLMGLVEGGKITLKETGEKLGVPYRQAKRIRRALRIIGKRTILKGPRTNEGPFFTPSEGSVGYL
jgi:hypothetical protein